EKELLMVKVVRRGRRRDVRFLLSVLRKRILLRRPLRTVAPNPSFLLKDVDDARTAESREDEHVSVPRHDSANISIHNYAADPDESFDELGGHGLSMTETVETHHADETRLTETPVPAPNPKMTVV
ncbi:hypothetical protein Tco_0248945, partial [Tanacetum coccineum]